MRCGPGRADKEGREPRAGDAGPLAPARPLIRDKGLTGSWAACKECGTRRRAGARARHEGDEAGDTDKARLRPGFGR